jgi:hypothetical protein
MPNKNSTQVHAVLLRNPVRKALATASDLE